jgi:hypothetical protein
MRAVPEDWLQRDGRKSPPHAARPPRPKASQPPPQLAHHHRATASPFGRQYMHLPHALYPADPAFSYQQQLSGPALDLLGSFLAEGKAGGQGSQRSSFSQLPAPPHCAALPLYAGAKAPGAPLAPADTPAAKRQRVAARGPGAAAASGGCGDSDTTSSQHWDGRAAPLDAQHSEVDSGMRR